MCRMNKWVEETQIWRDKQFSLVSWQKILEEQRRLKREQEEADAASRRHTGIVPTHHQFITNERFGDLLNITDNTERRKSGIEVQYRALSYPSVSRKKGWQMLCQFLCGSDCEGLKGSSAGFSAHTEALGQTFKVCWVCHRNVNISKHIYLNVMHFCSVDRGVSVS